MLHSRSLLFSRNTFIIRILSNPENKTYEKIPADPSTKTRKVGFSHTGKYSFLSYILPTFSFANCLSPTLTILFIKNISR